MGHFGGDLPSTNLLTGAKHPELDTITVRNNTKPQTTVQEN